MLRMNRLSMPTRIIMWAIAVLIALGIASCGGSPSTPKTASAPQTSTISDSATNELVIQPAEPEQITAWVAAAPADGATISGIIYLEVRGSNIANAELLPASGFTPKYAVFAISPDKTTATATFDTTQLPDGPITVRISAFDTPPGSPTGTEIIAMPARTWTVRNSFNAQVTLAPADGATIAGTVNFEVKGAKLANVELLPATGYLPKYASFAISADKTTATATLDTTKLPDGPLTARISAFDAPAGSSSFNEIIAMPARTWTVKNSPGSFSAKLVSAPLNGATVSGKIALEVTGNRLVNVELLPAEGSAPIYATFTVWPDGTRATAVINTTELPSGPINFRICAFDAPPGQPANEIVAMTPRTWNIRNDSVWTIVDMGSLGGNTGEVTGINDAGDVVGSGYIDGGDTVRHAFLYKNGQMFDLGTLGGAGSTANAINNLGHIVGSSSTASGSQRAFLYKDGVMSALNMPPNVSYSDALGINDTGTIAGRFGYAPNPEDRCLSFSCAFIFTNGQMVDLGDFSSTGKDYGSAVGVNNTGQVIGNKGYKWSSAVLYFEGVTTYLGRLEGGMGTASAYDINNMGQIVGESSGRAFLYSNGAMTDVGILAGGSYSSADGINDSGHIVGTIIETGYVERPFLYKNGSVIALNSLPEVKAAGWTLARASAINNSGQIAGTGINKYGQRRAFLLTPPKSP